MIRPCLVAIFALAIAPLGCVGEPELELPPPRYEEREAALAEVREKLELLAGSDVEQASELLGHDDHRVRRAAAKRLGEIGTAVVTQGAADGGAVDGPDAGDAGPDGVDPVPLLIARLKDKHPRVQTAAATALGQIGDTRALDPLIATLADEDRFVRLWAWKGLRKFGDAAVPVLISHTSSKSPFRNHKYRDEAGQRQTIREPLRQRLTSLGKGVVPALTERLGDEQEDGWVRINAAIILGMIGADAADALPTMLANVDTNNKRLRLEIVRSLGHIGDFDPEVVPTLERLKKDRSRGISGAAKAALKEISKEAKDKAAKEKKKRDRDKKKQQPRPRPNAVSTDDKSGREVEAVPNTPGAAPLNPAGAASGVKLQKSPLSGQQQVPGKKQNEP